MKNRNGVAATISVKKRTHDIRPKGSTDSSDYLTYHKRASKVKHYSLSHETFIGLDQR